MNNGGQKLEEELLVQLSDDLHEILEEAAEEYGTTVELIVNAILRELLDTTTDDRLTEAEENG